MRRGSRDTRIVDTHAVEKRASAGSGGGRSTTSTKLLTKCWPRVADTKSAECQSPRARRTLESAAVTPGCLPARQAQKCTHQLQPLQNRMELSTAASQRAAVASSPPW